MLKVIITESQYKKLMESGSNSVAMDLDIYTHNLCKQIPTTAT